MMSNIGKKNQGHLMRWLLGSMLLVGVFVKAEMSIAHSHPSASGNICSAQLRSEIDAIVNRPEFARSRLGILVETLSSREPAKTLYALEAKKYFTPASTAKLLTTAAALSAMNPNFRIRTSVYGTIADDRASLRVVGRGDPTIQQAQLEALAQQLHDRGIRQVDRLIAEDTYFQGSPINPNWQWEDIQAGYGARVNSLIFNQNAIDLILSPQKVGEPLKVSWADPQEANQWQVENNSITVDKGEDEFVQVGRDLVRPIVRVAGQLIVGSASEPIYAAVVDPGDRFLQRFRQALVEQGIRVNRTLLVSESFPNSANDTTPELAAIESPPLSELVMEVNKTSNNLYAEVLLKVLGVTVPLEGDRDEANTSTDAGLAVVTATLTQLGVNPDSYILADGSGLSRHNAISPEALVQTLRVMASSDRSTLYRDSLPVRELPNGAIVQAKSGGMSGVSSLAGYVNGPLNNPLVFAIILNHSADNSGTVRRQAISEIVQLLGRLDRC